jgi:hypothetical protein
VPLDEDSFAYAFRSSGGLTYRLENDCENANTHAHGDVHLVMFDAFVKVKHLFSIAPDAKKQRRKGVIGVTGRATGRWIGRGWRVRSAHPTCRGSSACTGASGRSRDWRVWSSSREVTKHTRSIGRGGVSGHDRLDVSDCVWVLTGIDRTLALWHPVSSSIASDRLVSNAIQWRPDATTASG